MSEASHLRSAGQDPAPQPDQSNVPIAAGGHRWIAVTALAGIAVHVLLRLAGLHEMRIGFFTLGTWPLLVVLAASAPLLLELAKNVANREFNADLLAGISIVTAILLGEYLAGALVVLMLSGGEVLEAFAVRRASFALEALAKRLPAVAHRKRDGVIEDIALAEIAVGDLLAIFPHETCPIDGVVVEGRSTMDEAYLTGEPFRIQKAPGSAVLSGAINGEDALVVRVEHTVTDSRYSRIMRVMRESEQRRPKLRRLGDQLGAWYTPLVLIIAIATWAVTGNVTLFLAVLVVATPCPLLIAIPVAIIGAVSLAARRGIIVKDPAALEVVDTCRVAIFDKTGTLTYGTPELTEMDVSDGFVRDEVLTLVASLERFSRHPLAPAILKSAEDAQLQLYDVEHLSEPPGAGLIGTVRGHEVRVTSRKKYLKLNPVDGLRVAPEKGGLECVVAIDNVYAATFRFRDAPRAEGKSFVQHLAPRHGFERVLLVSGDRESEVRYLADAVGITEVYFSQSPEQKVELVRRESALLPTLFMGDGINDAPALAAATVGIAFGQASDVTSEAAGIVILDNSLERVDELLHIGRRMRTVALQSAVGGMLLSLISIGFAATGHLPPVSGALIQEAIDVLAILNALRTSIAPGTITDFAS